MIDLEDIAQPITIDEEPPASEEEASHVVVDVEPPVADDEPEQLVQVPVKKQRASRAKKQPVPEEKVEAVVEPQFVKITNERFEEPEKPEEPEKTEEPEKPAETKNTPVIEQVPCPDCGKKMTARTLKYSHSDICPVKFPKQPRKQSEHRKIAEAGAETIADARVRLVHDRIAKINQRKESFKTLFAQAL